MLKATLAATAVLARAGETIKETPVACKFIHGYIQPCEEALW